MGRPGAFCAPPTVATPVRQCQARSRCCSFVSLAEQSLRGKRVLIYGDSVPTQVLFAMLCDLHRHRLLTNGTIPLGRTGAAIWPDGAADSFNDKPLTQHWDRGVHIPSLGLTLSLIHQTTAAQRYCAAREAGMLPEIELGAAL